MTKTGRHARNFETNKSPWPLAHFRLGDSSTSVAIFASLNAELGGASTSSTETRVVATESGDSFGFVPRPLGSCTYFVGPFVSVQIVRAGAHCRGDVVGVPDPTRGQREAAAADACFQLIPEPGGEGDLLVQSRLPCPSQASPVARSRRSPARKRGERHRDLLKAQPDALRGADEAHAAQDIGGVSTMAGGAASRADQPVLLVEP